MFRSILYPLTLEGRTFQDRSSLLMNGKFNLKCGSFPYFALDADLSSVILNNPIRSCETQAGSLSHLLCGEERIEDSGEVLFRNALAGIREFHKDRFSIQSRGGSNRKGSAPMHGLCRI